MREVRVTRILVFIGGGPNRAGGWTSDNGSATQPLKRSDKKALWSEGRSLMLVGTATERL